MARRRTVQRTALRTGVEVSLFIPWNFRFACHSFLLLAVALVWQLANVENGLAFEAASHEAISMTALSGLSMQANQALRRLLNGRDVADVSGWAHRVNEKYPGTLALHFQLQEKECPMESQRQSVLLVDRTSCSRHSERGCLLEALTYFFYRLTDPQKISEERAEGASVVDTHSFQFPHGIATTDADAVKYVIHLIGDMHEPLHWSDEAFAMGKNIKVEYEEEGEKKQTSFYEFLEGAFVSKLMRERQTFWFSGWTHINSIKGLYEEAKTNFAARKEESFLIWAAENKAVLCNEVMPLLRRLTKKGDVYLLDRAAEFVIFEILKKRILIAGARVAIVMNHILQIREKVEGLGRLSSGSGMQDVADSPETSHSGGASYAVYIRNFLINLSICVFLLLVIFLLRRLMRRKDGSLSAQPLGDGGPVAAEATELRVAKSN